MDERSCCCTGERRWFFWIRAKHSATLPGSKYKTSDDVKVLVERVADIRCKGVDGESAWIRTWQSGFMIGFC
jgi:hypothetical protein